MHGTKRKSVYLELLHTHYVYYTCVASVAHQCKLEGRVWSTSACQSGQARIARRRAAETLVQICNRVQFNGNIPIFDYTYLCDMGNEASAHAHPPSVGERTESVAAQFTAAAGHTSSAVTYVSPLAVVVTAPPSEVSASAHAVAASRTGYVAFAHARSDADERELGIDGASARASKRDQLVRRTLSQGASVDPKLLLTSPLRPTKLLTPPQSSDKVNSLNAVVAQIGRRVHRRRDFLQRARDIELEADTVVMARSADVSARAPALPHDAAAVAGDASESGPLGYVLRMHGASMHEADTRAVLRHLRTRETRRRLLREGPLSPLWSEVFGTSLRAPPPPPVPAHGDIGDESGHVDDALSDAASVEDDVGTVAVASARAHLTFGVAGIADDSHGELDESDLMSPRFLRHSNAPASFSARAPDVLDTSVVDDLDDNHGSLATSAASIPTSMVAAAITTAGTRDVATVSTCAAAHASTAAIYAAHDVAIDDALAFRLDAVLSQLNRLDVHVSRILSTSVSTIDSVGASDSVIDGVGSDDAANNSRDGAFVDPTPPSPVAAGHSRAISTVAASTSLATTAGKQPSSSYAQFSDATGTPFYSNTMTPPASSFISVLLSPPVSSPVMSPLQPPAPSPSLAHATMRLPAASNTHSSFNRKSTASTSMPDSTGVGAGDSSVSV